VQRRVIINLILIGSVIALAMFLVNTSSPPANPIVPLTTIAPQSIESIDIRRDNKPELRFRKSNSIWLMTAPLEVRANDDRINAMLQLLQTPSFNRLQSMDHDLSRFDLAPPAVVLREDAHEFQFGGTNPLEGRRYVMIGATIHLIPDGLFPQLQQDPAFFISPRLIPEDTLLQEISLPDYNLNYVNHAWQSPATPDLESAVLERLAANWLAATAVAIGSLEPAPSLGKVRITTRNGESIRFEILQREPLLKLARTDLNISYTMPAGSAEALLKP